MRALSVPQALVDEFVISAEGKKSRRWNVRILGRNSILRVGGRAPSSFFPVCDPNVRSFWNRIP